MTCKELLQRFVATVERGEPDWVLLRKLMHKCGAFGAEALKALAKKAVQAAVSKAWALWPFLVMPATAEEEKRCGLPDDAAEAWGPTNTAGSRPSWSREKLS
jgi:hypothetical protein